MSGAQNPRPMSAQKHKCLRCLRFTAFANDMTFLLFLLPPLPPATTAAYDAHDNNVTPELPTFPCGTRHFSLRQTLFPKAPVLPISAQVRTPCHERTLKAGCRLYQKTSASSPSTCYQQPCLGIRGSSAGRGEKSRLLGFG